MNVFRRFAFSICAPAFDADDQRSSFEVRKVRRIEDAEIAAETDAAIGGMVVDRSKRGFAEQTAALIGATATCSRARDARATADRDPSGSLSRRSAAGAESPALEGSHENRAKSRYRNARYSDVRLEGHRERIGGGAACPPTRRVNPTRPRHRRT
ncbi:MAG: hypothetical protein C3F11_14980 [Methylocystaceae bacterium]|nr:MAG: hypothetical protein C3F11_14980 [Methylocystaceae bacterium]